MASPRISTDQRSMLWVIATLGIAMSLQLPRLPLGILLIAVAPLLWRVAAEIRQWKPMPAIWRYVALGLSLLLLLTSYGNVLGRSAAVGLLTVMLAMKLLETYKIRDARVVVSFSLFLAATQFLFNQGVMTPLYGAAVVATAMIALAHLHRREAFAATHHVPALGRSVYSELGFSFRILALALPAALALFLLFPRWSSPLWGVPESSLDARTGLADTMSPGSIQQLFIDDSPAFRVEFNGPVPRQDQLYWRGPVLWNYDGEQWEANFWSRNIEARERPEATPGSFRYTVQLEPNERKWLFALDYPVTVPSDTRLTMDFQMLRRTAVTQLARYQVTSNPDFVDTPNLSQVLRNSALQLPQGLNSRTQDLVDEWRAQIPDDLAFAQRVLRHFNEESFHYTLDAPLLGLNAVDDFLFRTRAGYCEHYASSFTVMMRMAGIPARVVTGYQGGWFNEFGDYMLVRQSDAHAWSEIWLEGQGWTRVDPTAAVSPARVEQGSLGALSDPRHMLDFGWVRTVRNGFDVMQRTWNDWVIDFSAAEQARLFAPLGLKNVDPKGLMAILLGVIAVLSAILMPLILKTQGPRRRSPLQATWMGFLKRLEKAGVPSRPSMGASAIADTAAQSLPSNAGEIRHIAELYNRYRYSGSPPQFRELKEAVKSFKPSKATEIA